MRPATELATRISRALITSSSKSTPTRSWTPSLEHTLHHLNCRNSLSPSLVARVIDPFLLTHHSLALGFFNWATQQPGFTHSSLSYESILKSLSNSRQFNAIESLLKQAKTHKIVLRIETYRDVIGCLIKCKKTHNAFLLFNDVRSRIDEVGADRCNSLLAALGSDGYFDNGLKLFDEMSQRNVCVTTAGFGVFVWRYCRNNDLCRVLNMIDTVKAHGFDVNGSVVAVLVIHGLCEGLRVKEALRMLDELRNRGWKPDFMAYRIVAEALLATGNLVDREMVLKKKRKLGVAPRSNDYREFILDMIVERRIMEAKDLGEVIVDGNFSIEEDVLNALIGSVSLVDPSSAVRFFNYMIEKGKLPTLLTVSNLSRNLCKHDKYEDLLEVYRVLKSNDFFSNMESYSLMVSFLCKAGRVREAYDALQWIKKEGFGPDVSLYNSLIEACCREDLIRPAKKLWDEMFASGCTGNLKTYNILISKFSQIGHFEDAERLFIHMLERGVTPDATIYSSLVEGLCQEEKFESASEIVKRSVQQNIITAQNTLSVFILCLCRKGRFLAASELLCSLSFNIGHSDCHATLLKCSADAGELHIVVKHVKWIQETSPSMMQVIANGLLGSLSSSSKPEQILQLLQAIQNSCPDSSIYKEL